MVILPIFEQKQIFLKKIGLYQFLQLSIVILGWCNAQDLLGSQIPVTTGGLKPANLLDTN